MVEVTAVELETMMRNPANIRNVAVVGHLGHGKTSLVQALTEANGITVTPKSGEKMGGGSADGPKCVMTMTSSLFSVLFRKKPDEEESKAATAAATARAPKTAPRASDPTTDSSVGPKPSAGINDPAALKNAISASDSSVPPAPDTKVDAERKDPEKDEFILNLTDSPGHTELSSKARTSIYTADGVLLVVDCIDGACLQTNALLRDAVSWGVKPVLFINKVDQAVMGVVLPPQELFSSFMRTIESVNVTAAAYRTDGMGDAVVNGDHCSVCFGSGSQKWGFSLNTFAALYAKKFHISRNKLVKHLWGLHYFDPTRHKFTKDSLGGKYKPTFVKFILDPIYMMCDAVLNKETDKVGKMLERLSVAVKLSDLETEEPAKVFQRIMHAWLPIDKPVLEMAVTHLPSPAVAQKNRVATLYTGPMDDAAAKAMTDCDPMGPLMLFVSHIVPTPDRKSHYALGRVFSGTVVKGMSVRIQGPQYEVGKKTGLYIKKIHSTAVVMGSDVTHCGSIPAGNMCALVGVGPYIMGAATITDVEGAHNIRHLKFTAQNVLKVAIKPKSAVDLPKLVEALRHLSKSDAGIDVATEDTGDIVVSGPGEFRLESCIRSLRDEYIPGAPLVVSEPVAAYREAVTTVSKHACLGKSPNKHNRVYMTASPLPAELPDDIESGKLQVGLVPRPPRVTSLLMEKYGFEAREVSTDRLWAFGPDATGPNMLIDNSDGVGADELGGAQPFLVGAFQRLTGAGPILGAPVRGAAFRIQDLTVHFPKMGGSIGSQVVVAARRAMTSSMYCAGVAVLEPTLFVEITLPSSRLGDLYILLSKRRGVVDVETAKPGSPFHCVHAVVPVGESAALEAEIGTISGKSQALVDKWQRFPGDPLVEGSAASNLVLATRERMGLGKLQPLSYFLDKL